MIIINNEHENLKSVYNNDGGGGGYNKSTQTS